MVKQGSTASPKFNSVLYEAIQNSSHVQNIILYCNKSIS